MIVGHTPWETEAETRQHPEHWLNYYRKAALDFLGRTPDRTIIEQQVSSWVGNDGRYRLRMEWDPPVMMVWDGRDNYRGRIEVR